MSHTAALERVTKTNGVTVNVDFECDILVLGYLACWASDSGSGNKRPYRGWGGDLKRHSITIGNDVYVAEKVPSQKISEAQDFYGPGVVGVLITKIVGARNGVRSIRESFWLPIEAFSKVRVSMEGLRAGL